MGLRGVFRGEMSVLGRQVVSGEVAKDSGMRRGGWDWVRASSGCPNVSEGSVVGPYVVEGPSSLRNGRDWTGSTSGRSPCCLGVREARSEVAPHIRRVVLHGNARVASWSRDLFGFRMGRVVSAEGGFWGRNGGWRGM